MAKEREAGIAALFRCSVTLAMCNAVAKTATGLLKLLQKAIFFPSSNSLYPQILRRTRKIE
jgi:hypothetical protein